MNEINPSETYYSQASERLLFRPFEIEDVSIWQSFFIDNPAQKYVGAEKLKLSPVEKAHNWIAKQLKRKADKEYGQLAVIEKSTGKFIGVGGIITREINGLQEFEITYSLLPSAWGKGFATELAIHFKNYAFTHIQNPSVISIIHVENEASIRVAKKNGMSEMETMQFLDMPVSIFRVSPTV